MKANDAMDEAARGASPRPVQSMSVIFAMQFHMETRVEKILRPLVIGGRQQAFSATDFGNGNRAAKTL
jgi:hypothetical protein